MKLIITFNKQNPDFDKDYAEQYHAGNESSENLKDLWSETLECTERIKKISNVKDSTLNLEGINDQEEDVFVSLTNMKILEATTTKNQTLEFAVSKKLVKKTYQAYNEKYDTLRFYFYFKNRNDVVKLKPGVFVLLEDLPNELKSEFEI